MKIGFISTELPYPPNSGGRIYIWERLRELNNEGHDIYLYSFAGKDEFIDYDQLMKVCKDVFIYRRNKGISTIFKSIYRPYCVVSRYSRSLQKKLESMIAQNNIDIIIADIPQVTMNIPRTNGCPVVLTQHNIEYSTFMNIGKNSRNYIKKMLFYFEGLKMFQYEKSLYSKNKIALYTFISESDKEFFEYKFGNKNTAHIPFGVNVIEGKYNIVDNYNIVFTGTMDYQPNIDAVCWFSRNVFPKIKAYVPLAKFFVVGKNPTQDVVSLSNWNEDIIVTGKVDSVDKYIGNCNLVVIPLLSGGGVKIKLFEAIQKYKLIVGTDKASEGTKLKNDEHLLIANDAEQFAKLCIGVLTNPEKYEAMVCQAVKLIQSTHGWNQVGKMYSNLLKSLIDSRNKEPL